MLYRKLKVIMHDRGYTYDDLAHLSGVPLATLTKIGSGVTRNPGFETMERIARTLRCSLDEFSEAEPMIPYGYESYVSRGLQLPSNMREYIRFLIDIEFDRMTYLRSHDYLEVKCFEFTTFARGRGEYASRIITNVAVEKTPEARLCTFGIRVNTDLWRPKFSRGALLGFHYDDTYKPRQGEIWAMLCKGMVTIGRFYRQDDGFMLRAFRDKGGDEQWTAPNEVKGLGKFIGVLKEWHGAPE